MNVSCSNNEFKPTIVIHGGAGTILRSSMTKEKETQFITSLESILNEGIKILENGGSALDCVTEAVRLFEENVLFNAGKGSVFTERGTNEMDASIMDGSNLKAGAVAGVSHIKNPILAARKVMENTVHVMLIGAGAEIFARDQGLEIVDPSYFFTENRYNQLLHAQQRQLTILDHDGEKDQVENDNKTKTTVTVSEEQPSGDPIDPKNKYGTVGAVALDKFGNLAAATSTGGMTNKKVGRVGDSPIIGAGCYANNKTVAVSSTGTGESFMRQVTAYDISAMMEYGGLSVEEAAKRAVEKLKLVHGDGGVIALDSKGNYAMPFITEGMYRGVAKVGSNPIVNIYEDQQQ
eukprot:gene2769-3443_t